MTEKTGDTLKALVDLTVKVRVYWTSLGRPDDIAFSDVRGTERPRMGTGFIDYTYDPVSNELCPCCECNGKITRKFWIFKVWTAHHVVYNTEEAKTTRVDLYYDDDSCKHDGRMKTLTGLKVVESIPDRDVCYMMCVTHDEALCERIKSAWSCWRDGLGEHLDLSGLDLLSSCDRGRPTLIVSHPHGKPKKITVGEGRHAEHPVVEYNTATCKGSSGAPVFWLYKDPENGRYLLLFPPVHSGTSIATSPQHQDKVNFGNQWWM